MDSGRPEVFSKQGEAQKCPQNDDSNSNVVDVKKRSKNTEKSMRKEDEALHPQYESDGTTSIPNLLELKILVDKCRHSFPATSLVRLHNIPKHYGLECEVLVKCEFENLSGSSFIRIAYVTLELLELKGVITPGKSTLITYTSPAFSLAVALADAHLGKNYHQIALLSDCACETKCNLLKLMNVKIVRSPQETQESYEAAESTLKMAQFLSQKISMSRILDPYDDSISIATHSWWTVPETFGQLGNYNISMVVCGSDSTGMTSAFSEIVKPTCPEITLVGVGINGQLRTSFKGHPHGATNIIDKADYWCKVNRRDSLVRARELIQMEGIPASPVAGAVLHGALVATKKLGFTKTPDKKILLILDDSMWNCECEYCSDQWMVDRNYQTPEDIESSSWFHLIRGWRVPMKEAVTVDRSSNTFDVYSMMKANNVSHIIVVDDAGRKFPVGIVSFDSLQTAVVTAYASNADGGRGGQVVELIGQSPAVSLSFKSVPISETLSSVLEVLKTHVHAVLIQKQWLMPPVGHLNGFERVMGILNMEDIVRFIVDLEESHSAKFGATLSGGFNSASFSCKGSEAFDLNDLIDQNELLLLLSSSSSAGTKARELNAARFAAAVAPSFAQQIVMNFTTIGPGPVRARARGDNIGSLVSSTTLLTSTVDSVSHDALADLEHSAMGPVITAGSTTDLIHAPASISRSDGGRLHPGILSNRAREIDDMFPALAGSSHTQSYPAVALSSSLNGPTKSVQLHRVMPGTTLVYYNEITASSGGGRENSSIVTGRNPTIIPGPSTSQPDSHGETMAVSVPIAPTPLTELQKFSPSKLDSSFEDNSVDSRASPCSFSPTSEPFSPCNWQNSCSYDANNKLGGRNLANAESRGHGLETKVSNPDLIYMESNAQLSLSVGPDSSSVSTVEPLSGSEPPGPNLPAEISVVKVTQSIFRRNVRSRSCLH